MGDKVWAHWDAFRVDEVTEKAGKYLNALAVLLQEVRCGMCIHMGRHGDQSVDIVSSLSLHNS